MQTSPLVRLQRLGGVAHLILNNPVLGNVLDQPMLDALAAATAELAATPPRAVLLTAAGKNFCVGGDIRSFLAATDREALLRVMAGTLHKSVICLAALPAPVIVAVQGAAAGAGLSLAAGADLLLAGRGASFSMAYAAIGLSCDGGASHFLPRLIGLRRTQELAYTNRRLNAQEALEWGMVTSIIDDEGLEAAALALAEKLAAGPTLAYAAMKTLLASNASLPQQLHLETDNIAAMAATADGGEGVAAFLARRKAEFSGG